MEQKKSDNNQALEPSKMTEGFSGMTAERSAELAGIAVAAAARAEVESSYIMALKNPRNEDEARIKIMNVCKNPSFAKKAIFKKPIGKTFIEGPSIRFAEEVIRHWKNVKGIQMIIYDAPDKMIFKQTMIDLEANVSYSEDVTVEKTVERSFADEMRQIVGQRKNTSGKIVYIVSATGDEIQIKKNAFASKVIRNSGLRLIPEHILEEAMDLCRAAMKSDIDNNPEAAKREIFDAFNLLGILPKEIEKYLGHSVTQTTPAEVADLRLVYQALKEGTAKWSDYVTPEAKEAPKSSVITMGKGNTATQKQEPAQPVQTQGNKAEDALLKTLETTRKAINERMGEKEGMNFFFKCLGSFGYEKFENIPSVDKKQKFLAELVEKFDSTQPKQ